VRLQADALAEPPRDGVKVLDDGRDQLATAGTPETTEGLTLDAPDEASVAELPIRTGSQRFGDRNTVLDERPEIHALHGRDSGNADVLRHEQAGA
jgi:hypothetical protein